MPLSMLSLALTLCFEHERDMLAFVFYLVFFIKVKNIRIRFSRREGVETEKAQIKRSGEHKRDRVAHAGAEFRNSERCLGWQIPPAAYSRLL